MFWVKLMFYETSSPYLLWRVWSGCCRDVGGRPQYNFTKLDQLIDLLRINGLRPGIYDWHLSSRLFLRWAGSTFLQRAFLVVSDHLLFRCFTGSAGFQVLSWWAASRTISRTSRTSLRWSSGEIWFISSPSGTSVSSIDVCHHGQ